VTRGGFYAWRRRAPSARAVEDARLGGLIRQIYDGAFAIYGAPRVHAELRLAHGERVGKKRVAGLMRAQGLRGADGRRGGRRTTTRDARRPSAPDLVDRRFARAEPNRLWVCDLKYIQTGQGFLFLVAAQDVFSRRVIGWSMRDDLRSELVLDALGMAVSARGPRLQELVARSDHGSQYTSVGYGAYAKQSGIDLSMGSIGDPWDNALAETFFASLEKELYETNGSRPESTPECGSSGTSNASTTPAAGIPASATSAPPTTKIDTNRRPRRPRAKVSTRTGQLQSPRLSGLLGSGRHASLNRNAPGLNRQRGENACSNSERGWSCSAWSPPRVGPPPQRRSL
jgi:putative transposase